MEKERRPSKQYGSLEKTQVDEATEKSTEDVVSMADSTITIEDIEGELCKIERIRDILVRRESELRYMMDDIQLCREITRLKTELQKLVSIPDNDKSKEDREREEELLQQINKLVETRDFLVDDVEFERLREREEDREMAAFLQSKFPKTLAAKVLWSARVSILVAADKGRHSWLQINRPATLSTVFNLQAEETNLLNCEYRQVTANPSLIGCLWKKRLVLVRSVWLRHLTVPAKQQQQSAGDSGEDAATRPGDVGASRGPHRLIMEFLLGNPFSTPVGQRIESATGSSLPSEDWALNMEICDMINSSEEGPKDAVRAIKKRIVGNKNFKEVMLTLTVLETCVKNCGYRFHILVTTRDFVEGVLVRSIIPRNNPPLILHDRVLSIIQAWADAFRSSPDLTGVVSVYEDLRRKGLEFPMTELDGYSPAQPQKKIKKLKSELGVVRSNLTMMSDMMSQLDPVTVKQADMELLEQLYTVCKEMQDRIVKIVPRLSEEKLIEELLAANDEMNTAFTRYHRFERRIPNGQNAAEKSHTYVNLADLALTPESMALATSDSSHSLSKPNSLSSHMARLSTSESDDTLSPKVNVSTQQILSEQSEVTVDGLAQAPDSRQHNAATIPINQSTVMDDIEKWLALDDEYDDFEDSDGVTSEEFDRFLAERAKAAERLPSLRASSQDTNHSES
ncbi:hypothetical protein ABVT39_015292 [Epinephelus coioides]